MYDHIVDQEIGKAIRHYAESNRLQPKYMIESAHKNGHKARNSKNDKKCVILFEEARFFLVMVLVQKP